MSADLTLIAAVMTIRIIIGLGATVIMTWVTYGYRHIASPRSFARWMRGVKSATPSELLRAGITVLHLKSVARIAVWGVAIPVLAWQGVAAGPAVIWVGCIDILLSGLGAFGAWLALYSQHKQIPEEDREEYNVFSSPLYPWARAQKKAALRRAMEEPVDVESRLRHEVANCRGAALGLARAVLSGNADRADHMARRLIDDMGDPR